MNQRLAVSQKPARRIGLLALRLGLAALFVIAGLLKLRQAPETFADSIASFRLLPEWSINSLALGLPTFEILAGIMLLAARPRRLGAFCILLMSVGFLLALALAKARGITVDCGCFGSGPAWLPLTETQMLWFDLVRDTAFTGGALALYRHDAVSGRPDNIPR